jgi:hypothetical protein
MKTNQIMIRPMGDFKVSQRTKDGFFYATGLIKQWNEQIDNQSVLNTQKIGSLKRKDLDDYLSNNSTKDYIKVISEKECINEYKGVVDAVRGKYGGGTWVHPMLFIDLSMWINPYFKYDVVKFVQDEMIRYRNLAGEAYPSMCKAVRSILPENVFKQKVRDLAKSLNIIVYGKHESEMRNKIGDEAKIRELYELELQIAQWIDLGFIRNYEDLKRALTKVYYQRYPNVLPM